MGQMDSPGMCFVNDLTGTYRRPANDRKATQDVGFKQLGE